MTDVLQGPRRLLRGCSARPCHPPACRAGAAARNVSRTHSRAVSQRGRGRAAPRGCGRRAGTRSNPPCRTGKQPRGAVLRGPAVSGAPRTRTGREGTALAQGHSGTPGGRGAPRAGLSGPGSRKHHPARHPPMETELCRFSGTDGPRRAGCSDQGHCTPDWGQTSLVPGLAWLCPKAAVWPGQPRAGLSLSFPIWRMGQDPASPSTCPGQIRIKAPIMCPAPRRGSA